MQTVFRAMLILLVPMCVASQAQSVIFQNGVTDLGGGVFYSGTVDTEFRAVNPVDSQADNTNISVDQFDGGFQTQGALRFENLKASQGGLVPDTGISILFAELAFRVSSSTSGNISFNRILGPDTTSGAIWQETDTWLTLGGDLEPDRETGLLDGYPILVDDIEARSTPSFVMAGSASGITRRFDVTQDVIDWLLLGQPNLGWVITNDSTDGWDFRSSEFGTSPADLAFRPSLTIAFATAGGQGDLNLDGIVDLLDYQTLLDNIAIELDGPIAAGFPGDLDFDRDVDLTDFQKFKTLFPGGAAGLSAALASVPEPATLPVAFALAALAAIRRRRR